MGKINDLLARGWPKEWAATDLDWWLRRNEGVLESAMRHVQEDPQPTPRWDLSLQGLTDFLSLDVEPHVFDEPLFYPGFTPTETQLNIALGYFLEGDLFRTRTFIKALYDGRPNCQEVLDSFDQHARKGEWEVRAEEVVHGKSRKRMDLVIGWPKLEPGDCQHVVVVEVKFKHHVTPGQLPAYREHIDWLIKNDINKRGMLLLTREGKKNTKNKAWISRSWLRCLSRWEKFLAEKGHGDRDRNFRRFRRMLWQAACCGN